MTKSAHDDELSPQAEADLRRALRVDEPMPDQVWARLHTALADEAGRPPAHRRSGSLWFGGIAAAAVLVVAGAVLWPTMQQDVPAPVAAPMLAAEPEAADAAAARMAAPASVPVVESGTDYRTATIDDSLIRLASNVVPDDTPTAGDDGFTATPQALNECLSALLLLAETPDPRPLVVDRATLDGLDVGILVLAPTGQRFEAFVVDLGCSARDPGVRLHRWVPAP